MKIFLFIISFLYIFGPVFRPIGNWFDIIFFISLILSLYGFFVLRLKTPNYLFFFYGLIPVFIYAVISIALYRKYDTGEWIRYGLIPIRIFITLYGGYILIFILYRKYKDNYFKVVLQFIFLAILIHAIIMIYQLYNPQFKDWVYSYTALSDFRSSYDYNFRMGGLSGGSGGSILSVVQSLGIIIIPFLYKKMGHKWKIPILLGGCIIFFSILICGRSGIWCILIFLPMTFYLAKTKKRIGFFVKYIFSIGIIVLIFIGTIAFFDEIQVKSPTYYSLRRSLDSFLMYQQTDEFQVRTVEVVADMWFLPNPIVFIAGNAEHLVNTQFERTLSSDVGYIRNLWGFGIVFAFLYWLPIFKCLLLALKNRKKYLSAAILLSLTLIMLVFQAKESFFYVRMFFSIYCLILFSLYIDSKKTINIISKTEK